MITETNQIKLETDVEPFILDLDQIKTRYSLPKKMFFFQEVENDYKIVVYDKETKKADYISLWEIDYSKPHTTNYPDEPWCKGAVSIRYPVVKPCVRNPIKFEEYIPRYPNKNCIIFSEENNGEEVFKKLEISWEIESKLIVIEINIDQINDHACLMAKICDNYFRRFEMRDLFSDKKKKFIYNIDSDKWVEENKI